MPNRAGNTDSTSATCKPPHLLAQLSYFQYCFLRLPFIIPSGSSVQVNSRVDAEAILKGKVVGSLRFPVAHVPIYMFPPLPLPLCLSEVLPASRPSNLSYISSKQREGEGCFGSPQHFKLAYSVSLPHTSPFVVDRSVSEVSLPSFPERRGPRGLSLGRALETKNQYWGSCLRGTKHFKRDALPLRRAMRDSPLSVEYRSGRGLSISAPLFSAEGGGKLCSI
jgi:hypothetical protein